MQLDQEKNGTKHAPGEARDTSGEARDTSGEARAIPIMEQIGEGIIPLSPETRYQAIVVARLSTARAMLHAAEYWVREGKDYPSLTRVCGNLMEADELICAAYCELLGVDAEMDRNLPTSSGV